MKVVGVQPRGLREVDRALLVVVGSWTVQDGAAVAVIRAADIVVGARLDEDHPTVVVLDAAGRRAIGLELPANVGEAEELRLKPPAPSKEISKLNKIKNTKRRQ